MRKLLACVTLVACSIATANAAAVLDQSNFVAGNPPTAVAVATALNTQTNGVLDLADVQFVTAGMSGLLSQVNLQLGTGIGSATFGVFDNIVFDSNMHVTGYNLLGSLIVNPSANAGLTGWTSFDTSGLGISLTSGQTFALGLIPTEGQTTFFPWARGGDTYAGGDAYVGARIHTVNNDNDYTWSNLNQAGAKTDFGFQTYMSAVPEPSTWALMLLGLGAVGFSLRRKRGEAVSDILALA